MNELVKSKDLQDAAVATMSLENMDTADLIEWAMAKKTKMDLAKAELDVLTSEIQNRAIHFQEQRHIKFTEWRGRKNALAMVTVAQAFEILNFFKLKSLLGSELIDEKVKVKPQESKYDVESSFKRALTAIILDDYEAETTLEDVIDSAGWCVEDPKKKASLLKKLKGDYKRDKKTVLDSLNLTEGDIDIDTELYLIYQIKNWELIRAFFDTKDMKSISDAVKRCVSVDETAKIMLKAV